MNTHVAARAARASLAEADTAYLNARATADAAALDAIIVALTALDAAFDSAIAKATGETP